MMKQMNQNAIGKGNRRAELMEARRVAALERQTKLEEKMTTIEEKRQQRKRKRRKIILCRG